MRAGLERRHLARWRRGEARRSQITVLAGRKTEVVSLACDDWILIAGLSDGLAKVYSIDSGQFVTLLNCRLDQYDLGPTEDQVLLTVDIGHRLVVTASTDGTVIVRNRQTFGSVYRAAHHGDQPVVALRLQEDLVVTGARQEVVVLRHRTRQLGEGRNSVQGEYMELLHRLENIPYSGVITCLDTDRDSLVTGTSNCLVVWSLPSQQVSASLDTGFVTAVLLLPPLCLTAGTSPCVKVWDICSGQQLNTLGTNYYRSTNFIFRCAILIHAKSCLTKSCLCIVVDNACLLSSNCFVCLLLIHRLFHLASCCSMVGSWPLLRARGVSLTGMSSTSAGLHTEHQSLSWTSRVKLYIQLIQRNNASPLIDIFRENGNEDEEWYQNIKSDKAGFPLAAINRYNLIMSVNNVIYLRDYVN